MRRQESANSLVRQLTEQNIKSPASSSHKARQTTNSTRFTALERRVVKALPDGFNRSYWRQIFNLVKLQNKAEVLPVCRDFKFQRTALYNILLSEHR